MSGANSSSTPHQSPSRAPVAGLGRQAAGSAVLFRAQAWMCALATADVAEIHRPLPVVRLAGAPPFVNGVSIVRGSPVPVVNVAALLGGAAPAPGSRIVSLRVGNRRVSLEVDEVLGVRHLSALALAAAPPLLEGAVARYVEELGTLDGRLLATLSSARILEDATIPLPTSEAK